MDAVYAEMVAACDRLLLLVTGPRALSSAEGQAAALETIELLAKLEGWLKSNLDSPPPMLAEEGLQTLQHRVQVLDHLTPVLSALQEIGYPH